LELPSTSPRPQSRTIAARSRRLALTAHSLVALTRFEQELRAGVRKDDDGGSAASWTDWRCQITSHSAQRTRDSPEGVGLDPKPLQDGDE
jgi:hypothetical protein